MKAVVFGFSSHTMILELEKRLTQARIDNWLHHDLFTYQWWLLVVVLIIPWIVWWRYVDKKRILEILVVGLMVIIIVSYLDAVLSEFGLWSYDYEIVPVWPRLITADFSALPVLYMFLYQCFPKWKSYALTVTIVSACWAFIGEPLLEWMDIYHPHVWKHYYSFPIYMMIGFLVKWLMQTLLDNQNKHYQQFPTD